MGATAAPRVDSSQTIVLDQAAKHRFNRALPQPTHTLALSALLPGQRPAVVGRVGRTNKLSLLDLRRASRLTRAQAAVPASSPVYFSEPAVLVLVKSFEN